MNAPEPGLRPLGETWRDWHFGDEPCPFSDGCSEPLRSHFHFLPGPDEPVRVVYYDQTDYYGTDL